MKLVELSDQELIEVNGGDGWHWRASCQINFIPPAWGCGVGVGYSGPITLPSLGASLDDRISAHNHAQWHWGEAIRKSDDGKEFWSANTAPTGSISGYR
jgi:hypothetical protein